MERRAKVDSSSVADLVVLQWQNERNTLPASQPDVSAANDLDIKQQAAAERWASRQDNSLASGQGGPLTSAPTLKTPDLELKRERDYDRGGPEDDL